jgi:hypothetical protein
MAAVTAVYPVYRSSMNGIMASGLPQQLLHLHSKIHLTVEMYEQYSLKTF